MMTAALLIPSPPPATYKQNRTLPSSCHSILPAINSSVVAALLWHESSPLCCRALIIN